MITVYQESWVYIISIYLTKKKISVGKKLFLGGDFVMFTTLHGGVRQNDYSITQGGGGVCPNDYNIT